MKIDFSNGSIINTGKFSIHDDIFINMLFERKSDTGIITLVLQRGDGTGRKYSIKYINALGYEGTSCSFWGVSPHFLDLEYIESKNRTLLPKLYEIQEQTEFHPRCKLLPDKDYIETTVYFISGDKLTIVCEYMEIDNDIWEERSTGNDPFWQDLQRS